MNIRALNLAGYSQHPWGDIRLRTFIRNIKNLRKNKSNGHWNWSNTMARKESFYDLLLTKVASRLVCFQGNKLWETEWKINSPFQQSTMLSEFIVTLLYPSHTRWINCVNTQYFHLSWWQEGPGGPGRKGPRCYLSDSLAAAARSSFFDQNFPWERGNTAFQLVSLYAWHQQMQWASPPPAPHYPRGRKAPGLNRDWRRYVWQQTQSPGVYPGDTSYAT